MAVGLTDLLDPVPRPLLHVTVPAQPVAVNVALCPLVMLDALAERLGAAGGTQGEVATSPQSSRKQTKPPALLISMVLAPLFNV